MAIIILFTFQKSHTCYHAEAPGCKTRKEDYDLLLCQVSKSYESDYLGGEDDCGELSDISLVNKLER